MALVSDIKPTRNILTSNESLDGFSKLSTDVIEEVFSFLTSQELQNIESLGCRFFADRARSVVWKNDHIPFNVLIKYLIEKYREGLGHEKVKRMSDLLETPTAIVPYLYTHHLGARLRGRILDVLKDAPDEIIAKMSKDDKMPPLFFDSCYPLVDLYKRASVEANNVRLKNIVRALLEFGDFEKAIEVAGRIRYDNIKNVAHVLISKAAADTENFYIAFEATAKITESDSRIKCYKNIAIKAAQHGNFHAAMEALENIYDDIEKCNTCKEMAFIFLGSKNFYLAMKATNLILYINPRKEVYEFIADNEDDCAPYEALRNVFSMLNAKSYDKALEYASEIDDDKLRNEVYCHIVSLAMEILEEKNFNFAISVISKINDSKLSELQFSILMALATRHGFNLTAKKIAEMLSKAKKVAL